MKVNINSLQFKKDMENLVQYSQGFLQGVQGGKRIFFKELGEEVKNILENYIDSSARVNPMALHHMYEWNQNGNSDGRLFDVVVRAHDRGLGFSAIFKQSETIKDGSKVPFYNKAKIMESGVPVVIKPKNSGVLAFEDGGETIFTKNEITVTDPGGTQVEGSFQKTYDQFFSKYFTQGFLRSSGVAQYLEKPLAYKENINRGKTSGRALGYQVGFKWIVAAGLVGK